MCLPEDGGLAHQQAKAGMNEFEREAEFAVAEIGVADGQCARAKKCRQPQLETPELPEVTGTAKLQGLSVDGDPQCHADAVAEIFLESRRSRKPLGGMN